MPFLVEIHSLLTTSPGNTIYYLVLAFAILGTYITVFQPNKGDQTERLQRLGRGLGILLSLRVLHMLVGISIGAGVLSGVVMPVLDRAVSILGIILIVWLWAAPEKSTAVDLGTGILAAFVFLAGIISSALWAQEASEGFFNAHWLDKVWVGLGLVTLLLGAILLLTRKPADYWVGIAYIGLEFTGYFVHLLYPIFNNNYAGEIRLAQMAAYPLLFALSQRLITPNQQFLQPVEKTTIVSERKRYNVAPQMLEKFLSLPTETDQTKLSEAITHMIAYALVGDICFWITPPQNAKEIVIVGGYDLIHERKIEGSSLELKHLPLIQSVFERKTILRLPASSTSSDLLQISSALQVDKPGHLMVAPILSPENHSIGAIALLSIYTNRTWSNNDEQYLREITESIGLLLQRNAAHSQSAANLAQFKSAAEAAQAQEKKATDERNAMAASYEMLKNKLTKAAPEGRIVQLEAEIKSLQKQLAEQINSIPVQDAQDIIKSLKTENDSLRNILQDVESRNEQLKTTVEDRQALQKALEDQNLKLAADNKEMRQRLKSSDPTESGIHFESELQDALKINARLQKMIGETEIKLIEVQNLANAGERANKNWSSIIIIGQELRQPMSSIIGYTDFLLSESVGLLGTLQRKFLERVKSSTERMNAMVENLIHIATVESGQLKLSLGKVNINAILDTAISATSEFLRSKKIPMLVNIPPHLPEIEGDKEALRQTVTQLLRNAGIVTPIEQQISVEAFVESYADEETYIHIKVSDSGGGIAQDDIPKIFDPNYDDTTKTIEGLGSNSVSLSIAKTLVEAHGGRLWVETAPGQTTFQILLPTTQETPAQLLTEAT